MRFSEGDPTKIRSLFLASSSENSAPRFTRSWRLNRLKHVVKLVDGQDFSHAGVVIKDESPRIGRGIEIPHAGFGPSDKTSVAEDHPRLLRARHEAIPKKSDMQQERIG